MDSHLNAKVSDWTPRVYEDDAPIERKLEQIREFSLTLRENLFETSNELRELKTRTPDQDNEIHAEGSGKTADPVDGKSASAADSRDTSGDWPPRVTKINT